MPVDHAVLAIQGSLLLQDSVGPTIATTLSQAFVMVAPVGLFLTVSK